MATRNPILLEDNYLKTVKLFDIIPGMVLSWIIEKGNTIKGPQQSYYDYFITNLKFNSNKQMRNYFLSDEIKVLKNNKSPENLDIPLMCKLVYKYITKTDDRSPENIDLETSLEESFNSLKNVRNKLCHCTYQEKLNLFGNNDEIEQARITCNKVLDITGKLFENVDSTELDRKKEEFNNFVKNLDKEVLTVKAKEQIILEITFEELTIKTKTKHEKINPYGFYGNDFKSIPLSDIFVDLVIEKSKFKQIGDKLRSSDLMELFQNNSPLSLIKGPAGAGKSTLLQYIIYEWATEEKVIKGISNYDCVLIFQCRNQQIGKVKQYFESLLPDLFKFDSFDYGEFLSFLKKKKILILVDGLDEINEASEKMIAELLNTFTSSNIIMTSRPESADIIDNLKPEHMNITTITLEGIPNDGHDLFIRNYFNAIKVQAGKTIGTKTPDKLLDILKSCSKEVKDVLKLPLNMCVIVYLYLMEDKLDIDYQSVIHLLSTVIWCNEKKMKKRIRHNELNKYKSKRTFNADVQNIKHKVEEIAFNCLVKNQLVLTERTYSDLESECKKNKLPEEEVITAYLVYKETDLESEIPICTFAHKTIQELFAANYLLRTLDNKLEETEEIRSTVMNDIIQKSNYKGQFYKFMKILISLISEYQKCSVIFNKYGQQIIQCAFKEDPDIKNYEATDFLKYSEYHTVLMQYMSRHINRKWTIHGVEYLKGSLFMLPYSAPTHIWIFCDEEMHKSNLLCELACAVSKVNCEIIYRDIPSYKDKTNICGSNSAVEKIINGKCKLVQLIGSISGTIIQNIPRDLRYLHLRLSTDEEAKQLGIWLQSTTEMIEVSLNIHETVSSNALMDLKDTVDYVEFFYNDETETNDVIEYLIQRTEAIHSSGESAPEMKLIIPSTLFDKYEELFSSRMENANQKVFIDFE